MTDLAAPSGARRRHDAPRPAVRHLERLAPVVFSHACLAMLTVTSDGVVVDVNAAAARLLRRSPYELVQEPIDRHVEASSGQPLAAMLRAALREPGPTSLGRCVIRRGDVGPVVAELVVSSGCQASGRELLLVQLVPPASGPQS